MLIGFDASRAFVNEATGTENYSLCLLRALSKVDKKNRYRVYLRNIKTTDYRLRTTDWPRNFEFKIISWPRFWTQFGLALETWKNPVDLLFIPAHTLPILRRRRIGISNFKFQISNWPKTVVTIHDLGVEFLPGYHQFPQRYYLDFVSKYACRSADAIIAVSVATKADILKRYQVEAQRVFVVHEGVDTTFFKPQSKAKVESVKKKYKIKGNYILFVGTVQPRKNLEMLIRAFARVCRMVGEWDGGPIDLQLVIAGKLGWNYQEILNAPKKFEIERRVKFLGYVSKEDLPVLYSGACVFAFPSLFEGFGLPILEAFSCGCSVVASDISPHREIFKKVTGNWSPVTSRLKPVTRNKQPATKLTAGILIKPNDVGKWTNVLYQYISQSNKKTLTTKARNLASKFSWDATANETLKILEGVLG